ncbi:hypothetical protein AMAG_03198 [Allomyces macrogynus ATCC 38327]|uniref:Uncharacterized protein n=1 Tax=Allomyces macrogynus (strain ATCC 38327) TaxID=578462 RepID=A0A0L0S553_ALLM3|nr:hypothetical protein AMAG_03198 [Allomyces macrogynus ATCC 38327]|eukprot:KNE57489.1 hypothetical protein AMAG_03198 [Allomyces macrogynus ATCC 38327]
MTTRIGRSRSAWKGVDRSWRRRRGRCRRRRRRRRRRSRRGTYSRGRRWPSRRRRGRAERRGCRCRRAVGHLGGAVRRKVRICVGFDVGVWAGCVGLVVSVCRFGSVCSLRLAIFFFFFWVLCSSPPFPSRIHIRLVVGLCVRDCRRLLGVSSRKCESEVAVSFRVWDSTGARVHASETRSVVHVWRTRRAACPSAR